ncbi:histidine triad nucleotide-binding protein [bacterium]|nr:histidine triad nucleotide-binding protein [bacterium]
MTDCIFCKIVKGEIPAKPVYESELVSAFFDIAPQAPVHVLVVPKLHVRSINDFPADRPELAIGLFGAIQKLVVQLGIAETGYRVVANTGQDGGQTVDHLHFHILGGRPFHWPPG